MKMIPTGNSFGVFMREMEKYPLLTKEEEYDLAVKYYENGDLAAANSLVVSNLRFVVKVASEYKSYGFHIMDLVQEGTIGLMRAVKKFNPYKGYRLISYAVWWIRVRIQDHIMKFWSNVKIGTTQSQRRLFQKIESAKRKLGIEGQTVGDENMARLADHFGVREKEIAEMQARVSARDLSLSQSPAGDGLTTYEEMMEDPSKNPEELIGELRFNAAAKEVLSEGLEKLSEREKKVINQRFFLETPRKLAEIGKDLGVSQERVRQIQSEALEKLRKNMRKKL